MTFGTTLVVSDEINLINRSYSTAPKSITIQAYNVTKNLKNGQRERQKNILFL